MAQVSQPNAVVFSDKNVFSFKIKMTEISQVHSLYCDTELGKDTSQKLWISDLSPFKY
jgi:hypothetical protein